MAASERRPSIFYQKSPRQYFKLVKVPGFKYHEHLMGLLIVTVVVRILETMFVVGAIGSAVVLVLSGIEDLKLLLGLEEENRS